VASLADDLKRVSLFSSLNQRQLKRLSRDFRERTFVPGMTPVRQGHTSGIGFFVITEGEASVSVDGREVARLGPGDHFGELGLIGERTRLATVTAETPLRCAELAIWHFRRFVKENPDVSWKLLQHLVDLLAEERTAKNRRTGKGHPAGAQSTTGRHP
jgi:CRP/FNR family transcriptional regulator, cyclic AMP receptor protein